MTTVGQLAQCFLSLDPRRHPARMAFYHYLKNFLPHEAEFTQEMIDAFYDRALFYQHWKNQKNALGDVLQADLEAIAARMPFSFDVTQIVHASSLQIIELENRQDFLSLIEREVGLRKKNNESVRFFNWSEKEILLVSLKKNGTLSAEIKSPQAFILDGQLQLLRPHSRLSYSPDLELEPNTDQIIMTGTLRAARFRAANNRYRGQYIQGTNFHSLDAFDRPAHEITEIFQIVKSIERFFINPVSDPYYQNFMTKWGQSVQSHEVDP